MIFESYSCLEIMQRVIWGLRISTEMVWSKAFFLLQYRQMRRREQDRLARMDADYQKRKEMAEFELRREERLKAAEERMAKKRLKRQKKQRKKEKWTKMGNGGDEANRAESTDDDEDSDDDKSKQ